MDSDDPFRFIQPLILPSMFRSPEHLVLSAWQEHLPFAFWVIEAHRPAVLVELGSHSGVSYFGFCQAVLELKLATRCYAVDTWRGDDHTGQYSEDIFRAVRNRNTRLYNAFSELVRSTFDDAADHFADGSVDLLHIDGFHTYEAVKGDFETWLPKLSKRAVVLMHDTNVRKRDFGVFRLFEELQSNYPSFEFLHGHGLGVLGVGSERTPELSGLFAAARQEAGCAILRELFSTLGRGCKDRYEITHSKTKERSGLRRAIRSFSRASN